MARRVVVTRAGGREKRKSVFLPLAFVAVAGISFALGMMVGGKPSVPVVKPPARVAIKPPTGKPADPVGDQLTFYNNLPRGEQTPLGSGINPPPPGTEPVATKPVVKPAVVAQPVAKKTVIPATKPTAKPVVKGAVKPSKVKPPAPKADAILYLVQAASFRERVGAESLAKKLHKLRLAAFVQSVDLGDKGVWYRVYSGPFTGKRTANKAVKTMRKELKLSPVIRKQS